MKHRGHYVAVGVGLFYGLACRLIFGLNSSFSVLDGVFTVMSFAFLFFVPLAIGGLTVAFAPRESSRRWPYRIFMPWVSSLLMVLAAGVLAWEGLICIVFALPIILVLASLGGIVAGLIVGRAGHRGLVLAGFAFLPFLVVPAERQAAEGPQDRIVQTTIGIQADPENVWREIVRVPEIRVDERRSSFFHFIGIPKPIEAVLSYDGVGGIREARFEKGIVFREKVKEWEPPRVLGFDIRVDPASIPPDALDEHVRVGDRHFDVLYGRFEIEPRPEGGVVLRLDSRHRITTPFNWYSAFWSDWVMRDIQETICQVIKTRSERL